MARGPEPLRNLADQLTLFKPGGQIMPLTLLPAPRFKKLSTPLISLISFNHIFLAFYDNFESGIESLFSFAIGLCDNLNM